MSIQCFQRRTLTNYDSLWTHIAKGKKYAKTPYLWGSVDTVTLSPTNLMRDVKAAYGVNGLFKIGMLSNDEINAPSWANFTVTLNVKYKVATPVYAITVQNDFNGNGSAGQILWNDTSKTSPYTTSLTSGHSATIGAITPQTNQIDGLQYGFHNWIVNQTNGPSTISWYITPTTNSTYKAHFLSITYITSGTMTSNEEWWTSPITLTGNLTIPSGVTLTIDSGVTANLNGYSIVSTGGTITNQGTISGLGGEITSSGNIVGLYPTIQSALSAAVSGQTVVVVSGNYTLTGNLAIPSGVTLTLQSGANISFNGYYIDATNGTFNFQAVMPVAYLVSGNRYYGFFTSFASALSAATSGQTVVVTSGSYSYTSDYTFASGVSITFNSGVTVNVNSHTLRCTGGGVFTAQSGVTLNGSNVTGNGANGGFFPSIQSAIGYLTSGTIQLKSTSYTESPSFSSKSNITLNGNGQGSTSLNGSVSITNSTDIYVFNMTLHSLSLNTSTYASVQYVTATGGTLGNDYTGTGTDVEFSTATNLATSFGYTSHGSSGSFSGCTLSNGLAGLYLTNNGSWHVGSWNSFCCNGYDISTTGSASAYAVNNTQYSRTVPNNFYGNVTYDGGETSVPVCSSQCGDALVSPVIANSTMMQEPSAMQTLDQDYLTLLGKIGDARVAGTYNPANYLLDYQQLIGGYEAFIRAGIDKNTIVYALGKLNLLYRAMGDLADFRSFVTTNLANSSFSSFQSYFKRYLIWQYVDAGQYANGVQLADQILSSSDAGNDLLAEMLYEKALIYKYYLMDNANANKDFTLLATTFPSDPLCRFAALEMTISPSYSSEGSVEKPIQKEDVTTNYALANYPNPFNPTTVISYGLHMGGLVTLRVYDILGREVRNLVNGYQDSGIHTATFDGSNLSSGIYFCRLTAPGLTQVKKMLLMK